MTFKAIDQFNRLNYGRSRYNMAFYCQWPIKSFTEISESLAFVSNVFVSLDDRDYYVVSARLVDAEHKGIREILLFIWARFTFKLGHALTSIPTCINCLPTSSYKLSIITKVLSIVNHTNTQWVAAICNVSKFTQVHILGFTILHVRM